MTKKRRKSAATRLRSNKRTEKEDRDSEDTTMEDESLEEVNGAVSVEQLQQGNASMEGAGVGKQVAADQSRGKTADGRVDPEMTGEKLRLSDNPTNKDLMTLLMNNQAETNTNFNRLTERLDDYERSLNHAHERIDDQSQDINSLRTENTDLRKIVDTLGKSLDTVSKQLQGVQDRQDRTERRSREWGIRIHGIAETPNENTRAVLSSAISDFKLAGLDTPHQAAVAIEHCHRLGAKVTGKQRVIIANMYSRPLRNKLLSDAKTVNSNKDLPIYFAEDMIKADHASKLRARNQMKEAHDRGEKVMFRRGQLIINSQVVAIKNTED